MIDKDDARRAASLLVRGGFEGPDDILEGLLESYFDPDDLTPDDEAWLAGEIARQFDEKRRAEASWPAETDVDRLERAFRRIEDRGVLALHCAGVTQSDAISDAGQEFYDRGSEKSGLTGYVFYHQQDVDGVLQTGDLYIGFGMFKEGDRLATPRLAVEQLRAAGFLVEWPNDPGARILVKGLNWLKRSPRD